MDKATVATIALIVHTFRVMGKIYVIPAVAVVLVILKQSREVDQTVATRMTLTTLLKRRQC
jgi:hypothetical protein